MPYEFLKEAGVAAIAFKAWGEDLDELFLAAAEATTHATVEDLGSIQPTEERKLNFDNEALDLLLFDFLQELLYYRDAEDLLLRVAQLKVQEKDRRFVLEAEVRGEKFDSGRHRLRADVKTVTLHQFRVEANNRGWETQVIVDI